MEPERKKKRKSRFLPGLLFGILLGWIGASVAPASWQGFVPDALRPGGLVDGEVLDKSTEEDRLLLKLRTESGMVLATFTERQEEIDLLVENGDSVTIRVPRYEPFLTDPPIERVARPSPTPEAAPPTPEAAAPIPMVEPGLEPEPAPEVEPGEPESEPSTTSTSIP